MGQSVSGRSFARHASATRRNSLRGRRIPLLAPSTAAARAARRRGRDLQCGADQRSTKRRDESESVRVSTSRYHSGFGVCAMPAGRNRQTTAPSPQFAPPQRKEESGMNRSFLALWSDESAFGDDRRRRLGRLASAGREAQESQRCSDSDENFLHGLSPLY